MMVANRAEHKVINLTAKRRGQHPQRSSDHGKARVPQRRRKELACAGHRFDPAVSSSLSLSLFVNIDTKTDCKQYRGTIPQLEWPKAREGSTELLSTVAPPSPLASSPRDLLPPWESTWPSTDSLDKRICICAGGHQGAEAGERQPSGLPGDDIGPFRLVARTGEDGRLRGAVGADAAVELRCHELEQDMVMCSVDVANVIFGDEDEAGGAEDLDQSSRGKEKEEENEELTGLARGTQEVWHEAEFAKELERMWRAHCEAEDKAAAANK